ncbi:MAG: TlyA family RNA methyltransferase [Acidimicrobiales bacterium]|nr:TlyA family RNA methyltransferase [Acidimicrobiales bacterium]
MTRRRLDLELVRRGLAPSRQSARLFVDQGRVTVGGAPALKASRMVGVDEPIALAAADREFASRGGHKLDAALDAFEISVRGLRVLDAGASTGGFTDCVLQRGASSVVAVDVGYGQLALHLRDDPRVDVRERTNVRHLDPASVDPHVDLVVADLSFISLLTVFEPLLAVCAPGAQMVLLVKPQFEAGRSEASRGGGVIRDPAVWEAVLHKVTSEIALRGTIMGVMLSPVRGPRGNREFLLHVGVARPEPGVDVDAAIEVAVATACAEEGNVR